MAEPFLSEIRIFSFNFAPKGWALCNGQLLPINQNQALFSLLGTTYGGNGQTNFALPNLRGRASIHEGSGHTLGRPLVRRLLLLPSMRCPRIRIFSPTTWQWSMPTRTQLRVLPVVTTGPIPVSRPGIPVRETP